MAEGMEVFEEVLSRIPGGPALDVASGPGSLAGALKSCSNRCTCIVAVDSSVKPLEMILNDPALEDVIPVAMDAGRLAFDDDSFSTAVISNSLHHMEAPVRVLQEMFRVLVPGGMIIVREMFADGCQTPAQETHTLMHNWWGRVDTSRGIIHRPVFTAQELKDLVMTSGAEDICFTEVEDLTGNPFDEKVTRRIEKAFDAYMDRADTSELRQEGRVAMDHLKKHGFAGARAILAYGYKPASTGDGGF
mgnify:CR=1 FL=1